MENKHDKNQIPQRAEKPSTAYCPICRKLLPLEVGQPIPRCCGRLMELLD